MNNHHSTTFNHTVVLADANGVRLYHNGENPDMTGFTGTRTTSDTQRKQLVSRAEYKNGVLHGEKIQYSPLFGFPWEAARYENGVLKAIKQYDPLNEGVVLRHFVYDENGERRRLPIGLVERFNPVSGFCEERAHYNEDGVLHGARELFDSEGNLVERELYKNGKAVVDPTEWVAVTHDIAPSSTPVSQPAQPKALSL